MHLLPNHPTRRPVLEKMNLELKGGRFYCKIDRCENIENQSDFDSFSPILLDGIFSYQVLCSEIFEGTVVHFSSNNSGYFIQ